MKKYFYNDSFNYFIEKQLCSIYEKDIQICNDLGLRYDSELMVLENGQKSTFKLDFTRNQLELKDMTDTKYFDEYLLNSQDLIDDIINLYESNVAGYPEIFL